MPVERNARGSIAILALWSVALIAALLAAANFTTRTETLTTRNALSASRARLAAEAGTQVGISRLLRRRAEGIVAFDGKPEVWQDGSTQVDITIVDEAGKIDLNVAPAEFLSGLFLAVGRSREEATLLACGILERRGEYAAMCPEPVDGTVRRARRFDAPEQLTQIPGIDDTLYDRIADYVTVATGATAIAPMVAERTALLAVPGATPALVDSFLAQRDKMHDLATSMLAQIGGSPFLMASPNRDFTIKAIATTADSAHFRADLQVRLSDLPNQPYHVLAWRTPPANRGRQQAAGLRRAAP